MMIVIESSSRTGSVLNQKECVIIGLQKWKGCPSP